MHRLFRSLVLLTCVVGCGLPPEPDTLPPAATEPAPPTVTAVQRSAIASVEGDVEAGIDAPWRMDPLPGTDPYADATYPEIPIILSIHDVSLQDDPETAQPLGEVCQIKIVEAWNHGPPPPPYNTTQLVSTIRPLSPWVTTDSRLLEIEAAAKWPDSDVPAANQVLCQKWKGQSCANVVNVSQTAEWNATFLYRPRQYSYWGGAQYGDYRPGDDVRLTVQAMVARNGFACPTASTVDFHNDLDLGAPADRFRVKYGSPNYYVMTVPLQIHLGEGYLPRFDSGWVYGDLHYHGQGTDNEGETGYAFRPTLQTMRVMGLDFLFATDHASNSGQTTDIDKIYIDNLHGLLPSWTPGFVYDYVLNKVKPHAIGVMGNNEAARDTNLPRFQALRSLLNTPVTGANAEALKNATGTFAPRIFLGGEVDVIPEMNTAERNSGSLMYGNGLAYRWGMACTELPDEVVSEVEQTTAVVCDSPYQLAEELQPGRFSVLDIQGLGSRAYARQHMVHLPTDGSRVDAFVPSDTTEYGGGHRHLANVLHDEYAVANKGYTFLAHPVSAASGHDLGRLGPDIVPYSDIQLRTAFESQAVLGLELWNEDNRMVSRTSDPGSGYFWKQWSGINPPAYFDLHHGLFAWDKMLQWGLRPTQTAGISWLPAGSPRKVFMAGGSDAHGDWNYRREGSIEGNSALVDTAIGKPRNLVNVGLTRSEFVTDGTGASVPTLTQSQVTTALASGEFSVTDGPALRIAIDNNNNGVIDTGDTMMGGTTLVPYNIGALSGTVSLLVEWRSTIEFARVSSIDLYVGAENDGADLSLVYAPENHGIHAYNTPQGSAQLHPYLDSANNPHVVLKDNYVKDPTGLLHIEVPSNQGLVGHASVRLNANAFTVGRVRIHQDPAPEPVCHLSPLCNKPGHGEDCEEICTDPPPPPPTYHFDGPLRPDHLYVRAFARTFTSAPCYDSSGYNLAIRGLCIERLAFSNPIWLRNPVPPPPPPPTPIAIGGSCNGTVPCVCNAICASTGIGVLKTCQARLSLGASCITTAQCNDDTFCTASGRAAICAPRASPGQSCTASLPCVVGSTCLLGTCGTRSRSTCGK